MALKAREQLYRVLNHWTASAAGQAADSPRWGDEFVGKEQRCVVADAEMLLCLLAPSFHLDAFSLADPARVSDVGFRTTLKKFTKGSAGDSRADAQVVPSDQVKEFINARIESFVDVPLAEAFSPGPYAQVSGGTKASRRHLQYEGLKVLDAYTLTASVCVQAMFLLTSWIDALAPSPENGELAARTREGFVRTRDKCSERLTHALLGVVRSFVVKTYDTHVGAPEPGGGYASNGEWERQNGRVWPGAGGKGFGGPADVLSTIRTRLAARPEYQALLRGRNEIPFACGFSWGPTSDAFWGDEELPDAPPTFASGQSEIWAVDAPYLYFTITALEGVADLLATKVRSANLLTRDQAYLVAQLGFLVENTMLYWRALAFAPRFGGDKDERWSLERLPWRTSDGDRDDYYSLYVTGLVLAAREQRLKAVDLNRLIALLEELAQRGRVTREPYAFGLSTRDPAVSVHDPGKRLQLETSGDAGIDAGWIVDDFAPKLLRLAGVAAQRAEDPALRRRALRLADEIWDLNLERRGFEHIVGSGGVVWDRPMAPYGSDGDEFVIDADLDLSKQVFSWHLTQRVADGLVSVTLGQEQSTTPGLAMRTLTEEVLDALSDRGSELDDVRDNLTAIEDELRAERPGRALQKMLRVLSDVEDRDDARNGSA